MALLVVHFDKSLPNRLLLLLKSYKSMTLSSWSVGLSPFKLSSISLFTLNHHLLLIKFFANEVLYFA
jgi:hypothetical protein